VPPSVCMLGTPRRPLSGVNPQAGVGKGICALGERPSMSIVRQRDIGGKRAPTARAVAWVAEFVDCHQIVTATVR
jgi:hypothetical protein